jgi:hypothetical protein
MLVGVCLTEGSQFNLYLYRHEDGQVLIPSYTDVTRARVAQTNVTDLKMDPFSYTGRWWVASEHLSSTFGGIAELIPRVSIHLAAGPLIISLL